MRNNVYRRSTLFAIVFIRHIYINLEENLHHIIADGYLLNIDCMSESVWGPVVEL